VLDADFLYTDAAFGDLFCELGVAQRDDYLALEAIFLVVELFDAVFHHEFLKRDLQWVVVTYFNFPLLDNDTLFEFVGGHAPCQFTVNRGLRDLIEVDSAKTIVM